MDVAEIDAARSAELRQDALEQDVGRVAQHLGAEDRQRDAGDREEQHGDHAGALWGEV